MFTEEQVNEALNEIKKPDVAGWELFSEVPNFKVYRRAVPSSALKEYKVLGTYLDLPPRYLLRSYTDLDFRKSWDKNMMNWKALENHRLHFTAKFPWPLSPRDYVYELKVQEFKDGVFCVNGKSVEDTSMPERTGTVRVDEFRQDIVIQPTPDGKGCNIWFGYFDNPKGNIPTSIINWAARSGIPGAWATHVLFGMLYNTGGLTDIFDPLWKTIAFLGSLRDAGHSLMKKDAEEAQDEKARPLSVNGDAIPVMAGC